MKRTLIFAAVLAAGAANAIVIADNASNSAYTSGWANGSNGGSGLGSWVLNPTTNGSNNGFFIGSSLLHAGGAQTPGIDSTGAKAWGLYARSSQTAFATRSIPLLGVGGSFQIQMDNGYLATGGKVGMSLTGPNGTVNFQFTGGGTAYQVIEGTNTTTSSLAYTSKGLTLNFTVLAGGFTLQATRLENSQSYTYNGSTKGGFNSLTIYDNFASPDSTGTGDAFFNNISVVVPEPSAIFALGLGAAMMIRRRKA